MQPDREVTCLCLPVLIFVVKYVTYDEILADQNRQIFLDR